MPTGHFLEYGIYDVIANRGMVIVGVSHNTPTFAAHAVAHWWQHEGQPADRVPRQLWPQGLGLSGSLGGGLSVPKT